MVEESVLLGCEPASVGEIFLTFQRIIVPPSSGGLNILVEWIPHVTS